MSHDEELTLTPDLLLQAYAAGIFPMADSADSHELYWFDPPRRGIIPLDDTFHVSKRLRRTIRQQPYRISCDTVFATVMQACAMPTDHPDRRSTWINQEIIELYYALHQRGHAHSIEAWDGDNLVGGLYGVSLGSVFCGESMFSRATDASKISLVYLVALLRHSGFTLLDTQFQTDHLQQFGTLEISRDEYHRRLAKALSINANIKSLNQNDWEKLLKNNGL